MYSYTAQVRAGHAWRGFVLSDRCAGRRRRQYICAPPPPPPTSLQSRYEPGLGRGHAEVLCAETVSTREQHGHLGTYANVRIPTLRTVRAPLITVLLYFHYITVVSTIVVDTETTVVRRTTRRVDGCGARVLHKFALFASRRCDRSTLVRQEKREFADRVSTRAGRQQPRKRLRGAPDRFKRSRGYTFDWSSQHPFIFRVPDGRQYWCFSSAGSIQMFLSVPQRYCTDWITRTSCDHVVLYRIRKRFAIR